MDFGLLAISAQVWIAKLHGAPCAYVPLDTTGCPGIEIR